MCVCVRISARISSNQNQLRSCGGGGGSDAGSLSLTPGQWPYVQYMCPGAVSQSEFFLFVVVVINILIVSKASRLTFKSARIKRILMTTGCKKKYLYEKKN